MENTTTSAEMDLYKEHAGESWALGLLALPEHMRGGVVRYVLYGIIPGSFLQSVIKSDLFMALRTADSTNAYALHRYGTFFFNYAPAECFGSPEQMEAWHAQGGMLKTSHRDTAQERGDA